MAKKTIAVLAKQADMTASEWRSLEEGKSMPTLGTLVGIAKALGCGVAELVVSPAERRISPRAEQVAIVFQQCPPDVQESMLNLLRNLLALRK
ncbi:MAG: helix-turn-helix transcriptional regulator [Polyangiaceae bacterium]|nr:helix-turn-helix transcriptional regulator [Polyangiaceae bacterium]NUQ77030.1 helix-turn-helix transcriptional regulator [Polyangiaceae bacterium]